MKRFLTFALLLCAWHIGFAADVKISELPTATTIASGDLIPFVQVAGPTTKAATFANFKVSLNLFDGVFASLTSKPTTLSGYGITDAQGLDSDLTAIAALTTTTFGRSLLTQADAAAARTTLGVGTGSGDALVASPLSQFAATTSAQLRGVLSDEVGTGAAYFVGGALSTPASGTLTNCTGLPQAGTVGLTTTDAPQFSNVRVTHSTLTYAGTTTIDASGDGYQTVTLTGDITFATSNLAAGRSKTIRIIGDSTSHTLTFPAWKFVGAAAPTALAGNKVAILTITSFSTTDANVIAAYAAEP